MTVKGAPGDHLAHADINVETLLVLVDLCAVVVQLIGDLQEISKEGVAGGLMQDAGVKRRRSGKVKENRMIIILSLTLSPFVGLIPPCLPCSMTFFSHVACNGSLERWKAFEHLFHILFVDPCKLLSLPQHKLSCS